MKFVNEIPPNCDMIFEVSAAGTQDIGKSQNGRMDMSKEQLLELEDVKRNLLVQAYRMKQEHPHMSPVGLEMEMYSALMAEVREITTRIQRSAEA